MPNVATSVRLAGDAVVIVAQLSEKLGQPKARVAEMALKELADRIFWNEVSASFAGPLENMRQLAETEVW